MLVRCGANAETLNGKKSPSFEFSADDSQGCLTLLQSFFEVSYIGTKTCGCFAQIFVVFT